MTLSELIQRLSGMAVDQRANLPYPNIYWVTIHANGQPQIDTYIAGAHTEVALQKAANWCANTHRFRPTPHNSRVKMRRMLLGDLLRTPAAYYDALTKAQEAGERDIVKDLLAMPTKVWNTLSVAQPKAVAASAGASDDLWQRLCREVSSLDQHSLRY